MGSKNFVEQFHETMDALEADAKKHGLNLTAICKEAEISRATPDRWKKKPPKTIRLVAKMQQVVEQRKAEVASSIPGEEPRS